MIESKTNDRNSYEDESRVLAKILGKWIGNCTMRKCWYSKWEAKWKKSVTNT